MNYKTLLEEILTIKQQPLATLLSEKSLSSTLSAYDANGFQKGTGGFEFPDDSGATTDYKPSNTQDVQRDGDTQVRQWYDTVSKSQDDQSTDQELQSVERNPQTIRAAQMARTAQDKINEILGRIPDQHKKDMVTHTVNSVLQSASKLSGKKWRVKGGHERRGFTEDASTIGRVRDKLGQLVGVAVKSIYSMGLPQKLLGKALKKLISNVKKPYKFDFQTKKWKTKNLVPAVAAQIRQAIKKGEGSFFVRGSRDPQKAEQIAQAYQSVFDKAHLPVVGMKQKGGTYFEFDAPMTLIRNIRRLGRRAVREQPKAPYKIVLDYDTESLLQFLKNDVPENRILKDIQYHLNKSGIQAGRYRIYGPDDDVPQGNTSTQMA